MRVVNITTESAIRPEHIREGQCRLAAGYGLAVCPALTVEAQSWTCVSTTCVSCVRRSRGLRTSVRTPWPAKFVLVPVVRRYGASGPVDDSRGTIFSSGYRDPGSGRYAEHWQCSSKPCIHPEQGHRQGHQGASEGRLSTPEHRHTALEPTQTGRDRPLRSTRSAGPGAAHRGFRA